MARSSVTSVVSQLERVAQPSESLIKQILQFGAEACPPLIELASRVEYLHDRPEPGCFAPVHALRFLIEIPETEYASIRPLFALLPVPNYTNYDEDYIDLPSHYWHIELLHVAASCPNSIAQMFADIDNAELSDMNRAACANGLPFAAIYHDQQAEVLQELRARLQRDDLSPKSFAWTIAGLALLHDKASYPAVMQAYRDKRVSVEDFPPAQARQSLLQQKISPKLQEVRLSMAERYEIYGPFDD